MYQLDLQSRIPIYQQLKERILQLVMMEAIGPGDPLPSVRVMARELGINPNTVAKAYQELERDGFIYSMAGKGSFINGTENINSQVKISILDKCKDIAKEARSAGISLEDVVDAIKKAYGGQ